MITIPPNWAEATVGDVAEYINGLAFKPSDWVDDGRPIIRIQNLNSAEAAFNRTKRVVEDHFLVRAGDLLVSWSATLDAFIWNGPEAVLNQHIFKVLPNQKIVNPGFLYWAMKRVIQEMLVSEHLHGSTMKHINRGPFLAHRFLLPPLNEQKRIVAKIEELTARSRRAKEALDAVPPLLDQLRQSILAAAFRGDLTADWRVKNPDVELGDQLLAGILAERRRCWEAAELAKITAKGKAPTDDRWKAKYQDPVELDLRGPFELPRGWSWATVKQLTSLVTDGEHQTPERSTSGVLLLSARNVHNGRLDLSNVDYIPPQLHERLCQRLRVQSGDVLLSCSGSVGRSCVVPSGIEFSLVRSAAVLRPVGILPGVLSLALRSPFVQEQIIERSTQTAQSNLFQGKIEQLVIPLPPFAEQAVLMRQLEASLSQVEAVAARVAEARKQLDCQDQSILAKAFRGELVPQDPTDEPASVLLDRIRAARTTDPPTKRPRKTKSPAPPEPKPASKPIRVPTQPQLLLDPHTLQEQVVTALWPLGPLDKGTAIRKAAESLRTAGHVDFQRLRADGPLYTQILTAIQSAVKNGQLDRPTRGYVRACKPDALAYTPDDWRHALVASLGSEPIDREQAIRNAAQWAREQLGLEFSRLRADGHIAEGLRSAITSAIRRGEIIGHAKRISRPA